MLPACSLWQFTFFYDVRFSLAALSVCGVSSLLYHLKTGHLGWFVSISPGDLGRLSIMGRDCISDDDCVFWRNHSTVSGHWDSCEYVVTCKIHQVHISSFSQFSLSYLIAALVTGSFSWLLHYCLAIKMTTNGALYAKPAKHKIGQRRKLDSCLDFFSRQSLNPEDWS